MGGMGLRVGVFGGSGYAGIELVRLLDGHPEVGALSVASRGYVGRGIGEVYPQLAVDGAYVAPEEIEASDLDVAFVAYGHGESAGAVKELLRSGTHLVIDLSSDFRLPHEELYVEWYGEHSAPELLAEAHFVSVNESASAYGAPRHRHTPEIETILRRVGEVPEVTFVPHLIPITRGELETIVVDVGDVPEVEEVLGWYAEDYEGWAFVEAREEYPHVAHVANTNRCRLSAAVDSRAGKLLLFSAVDNLLKGASGAAGQNRNLALGYEEYLGLEHLT